MIYIVKIGSNEYEVEVEKGQANIVKTTTVAESVAPIAVPVSVPAVVSAPVVTGEGEVVKAPMPGTILDVKVSVGARVKRGDILLILEAMKMENELAAPVDGVIAQILVNKGTAVATEDVLILIQ